LLVLEAQRRQSRSSACGARGDGLLRAPELIGVGIDERTSKSNAHARRLGEGGPRDLRFDVEPAFVRRLDDLGSAERRALVLDDARGLAGIPGIDRDFVRYVTSRAIGEGQHEERVIFSRAGASTAHDLVVGDAQRHVQRLVVVAELSGHLRVPSAAVAFGQ
jgi:hypothetical protein